MVEKKNDPSRKPSQKPPASSYSMGDVFKITDELFALSKEKEYHPGAFIHGLVFALEFAQQSYGIPQQQLAEIKRDCRRTVSEIVHSRVQEPSSPPKKK